MDSAGNSTQAGRRVSCRRCRHYRISWDSRLPYGCAAHNFKTDKNPARVVFESSGLECQAFAARQQRSVSPE